MINKTEKSVLKNRITHNNDNNYNYKNNSFIIKQKQSNINEVKFYWKRLQFEEFCLLLLLLSNKMHNKLQKKKKSVERKAKTEFNG